MFGLGVASDVTSAVTVALQKPSVIRRLQSIDTLVIDEVSMLPDYAITAAERVAYLARKIDAPWGGIRIIAVGDFRQLPPVSKGYGPRPWAFLSEAWKESNFRCAMLKTPVRSIDPEFVKILHDARVGNKTDRFVAFLAKRSISKSNKEDIPRIYGKREQVDQHNNLKLSAISHAEQYFETKYGGIDSSVALLRKEAPIPEVLVLKIGAFVMLRNNDSEGRWVNGTTGFVTSIRPGQIQVRLSSGPVVEVEEALFMHTDEKGNTLATATNYPLSLAWATTIHKSQGATFDEAVIDLSSIWEPGQLYVALSRVRRPEGVHILNWNKGAALKVDHRVTEFHLEMLEGMKND